MKKIFLILSVLLLVITGCSSQINFGNLSGTPTPTSAEEQDQTQPVGENDLQLTNQPAEERVTPIVPVSESKACLPPADHPELAYTDYQSFPQVILEYLNAGASPEELAVTLIVNGLGPKEQPVWAEDLTGDGVREVAVTVYDETQFPQGALLIYDCVDGRYLLAHLVISEQQFHAPLLRHIQDINADGLREVVYSSTNCGAHTCFEDVQILEYDDGVYLAKLEGSTLEFPYPEIKLTDYDHDGVYSLEVVGTTIASVGAGPQRDSINVWDFDSASRTWQLKSQSLAASPFRVHLLHDAEAAMDRGEYLIASLLFQQVIEDENLLEWAEPEEEYNNLAAYAYFKRVVAAVFLDDRAAAERLFSELEDEFARSDQYAYVEMAEVFLEESAASGLEDGCTAARLYADANEFVILTPLGSEVYGYANPDLGAADVCP